MLIYRLNLLPKIAPSWSRQRAFTPLRLPIAITCALAFLPRLLTAAVLFEALGQKSSNAACFFRISWFFGVDIGGCI